jgi:hypothetical protein
MGDGSDPVRLAGTLRKRLAFSTTLEASSARPAIARAMAVLVNPAAVVRLCPRSRNSAMAERPQRTALSNSALGQQNLGARPA